MGRIRMTQIHRDASTAWAHLVKFGGLELGGRDEGFDDLLKVQLDCRAPDLEAALASVTTDEFMQGFMNLMEPYAQMFRDILDFFEKAGAKESRSQWNIQLDGANLDLDHFRQFLTHWDSMEAELEVPAVDYSGAWKAHGLSRGLPTNENWRVGMDLGQQPIVVLMRMRNNDT